MTGIGLIGVQVQGVFPNVASNGVGDLGANLSILAINRLHSRTGSNARRAAYGLLLVVSLITLILAQTRSAILALLIGCVVILILSKRIGAIGLLFVVLAIVGTVAGDALLTYFMRDQSTEMFLSLTGRTTWWEASWAKIVERPLLGYGAYAGARFAALASLGFNTTATVHNSYMEVLLGTGILGLIPFLMMLGGTWIWLISALRRPLLREEEKELGLEAVGLLTMATVRSIFTANIVWHASMDFLLVLGYVEFIKRFRHSLVPR